jgi:hypothetical protein
MKEILTTIILAVTVVLFSCCKGKTHNTAEEQSPNMVSYTFDEKRIHNISLLCDSASKLLEDKTTSSDELNSIMSRALDSMEMVVRHCQILEFNRWIRGYGRHYMQDVILDDRLVQDVKGRFLMFPYEWTVLQTDTSNFVWTTTYRGTGEMSERFALIQLFSDESVRECMFVVCNRMDTVIKDVSIAFYDKDEKVTKLNLNDSKFMDNSDSDVGILRIAFPLDNILQLIERSSGFNITFNAKNEEVLFMYPFMGNENDILKDIFE